ncbi:MAG: glycosyltransferase family 4 protein [Candidatus Parvarchaeota archaeon]|nr:glycosyltransferase family 4 protein [Candidatus Jingweiarchaeum tengchongense]MCW1298586.1 glycosyltransferase family 4 protein [Candidatus Jingweiarchaeum tengchongense]MCW1300432.1 glycosyltransferase family 4 protein [Candidatus Jingweiarchaeum tengchongense]MCW1304610.1 glycosyltransferase family 4 protein [Candidatus Jingweiarchaeum tengchongense]MCW1306080.1 glycosyltransferase family 4 protein [Candidatus Jingweiarchaeum tengchongense]
MKIIMVLKEFPPNIVGGLGIHGFEISKALVRNGKEVHVITPHVERAESNELVRGIDVKRIKFPNLKWLDKILFKESIQRLGDFEEFFLNIISFNLQTYNEIIKLTSEYADNYIVHAHDWLGIIAGVMAKKELGIPLVVTYHSTEYGRSMGSGIQEIKDIEAIGAREADMIITVSEHMKEELKMLGYPEEKINVVYNGIDEKKYDYRIDGGEIRRRYGIKENERLVFFVGRLERVKGVEYLVLSIPKIIEKFPNTKFLILGIGGMQDYIKKMVENLKISGNVIMVNEFVSEEERIKFYAASDICIFPSLYEPFGIVALEAMAMKKPVIVGKTGGLQEIVIHEKTGLHVRPGNSDDIANAIIELLSDEKKMIQFGEEGRKRVEENFTWDKIAMKTIEVYQKLL